MSTAAKLLVTALALPNIGIFVYLTQTRASRLSQMRGGVALSWSVLVAVLAVFVWGIWIQA